MRVLTCIILTCAFLAVAVAQECPPCANNQEPLRAGRHGFGESGRPVVNIYVDSSTMETSQEAPLMDDIADAAATMWNEAENTFGRRRSVESPHTIRASHHLESKCRRLHRQEGGHVGRVHKH